MNYVMHVCRNPKCNNGWVDKDLTDVQLYRLHGNIVEDALKN